MEKSHSRTENMCGGLCLLPLAYWLCAPQLYVEYVLWSFQCWVENLIEGDTHLIRRSSLPKRGMAFLMEIGTAIVTKLAEYTVEPVIRQVGYVICYKNNLKELQSQVDDLVHARTSMQHSVEAEERKGKKIETGVQNWLTKAEQLTKEADEVKAKHLAQTKCLHGFCPNLKLRHRLSRKSTKLVQEVAKLCEKKKGFDNIAYVAPLEEVCIQNYEAIDSRTSTAKDVIDELRNSNTYMIGVYGIGGVGKTTLVKEVYSQLAARSEKLFEEVVMVLDLKQNPSIERIQKAIAEKLGLELPETGTSGGRASLISNRIKNKKTLVILDDVWENIDLEAVGLPRMATLKILLTSRSKLVLAKDMGTQKEFPLEVLNKEETWRLFQKMAGDTVKKPDIQTIAAEVAEKCGGLPLLIVTVARTLKDSPLHDWKDTFRRLKKFDGKGLVDKTHSAIEWSYNKLDSEELKSVFLLCASEAGSANIGVEILDLLKYSMGLGFIKNVDTMEEARDALNSLLKKLQYSCLLLDTDDNKWFRIHDLVKHVAQHIAARDHHTLSVSYGSELKEWPDKEFCEKCTRISLMKCQTPELPQVLKCPELTMFHLSSVDVDSREIPSNFFKEMKKLKVLDLTNRSIPSLPPSLKCLKDLQTLCLDSCTLGDVALVGELHNLNILSLLYSKFKQLPKEIGQLTRLQLLDLTGCSQLEVISPDVISKLKRLEELRMGKNSFNKWEAGRVGETKRSNASLEELKYLPRLTALHIHIPDATILPANLFTTSKLERFQICIGSMWKWDDIDEALNALKLKLTTNNELDQGLKMLLKRTQDLYVEGMEGVNDKFFRELATGGYQQLKHLHVQNNAEVAYTINEKVGFPNLTWLAVSEHNGLRFLLSSSMARSLSQLKRLQISGCQIMEEVISIEESNQEIAHNFFPQLQDLELKDLPNLTKLCSTSYVELPNPSYERLQLEDNTATGGICEEVEEIQSKRNLGIVRQHYIFENKVEFPNLKKLSLNGLAKLTTIWNNQLSLGSSKNLETIEIVSCDNLKSVFPASVAKSLQQLRSLKVRNCGVEEIISQEEGVLIAPMFVFSKVSYVRFENLPKLKRFYPGLHNCKWPSLESLGVYGCNEVHIFADCTRELDNLYTPDKQPLFLLEKDSFPNLEVLGFRVMENWDSPPLHLLRKLKSLYTYAHTNSSLNSLEQLLGLEKVNGETHAAGDVTFPFLRELYLYGMRKLINLGDDSFGPARLYFPKVEILKLEDCDSLKNLRSSAISFNNLTTLQVRRCKGLNYLISFSMATCLMQLTKLEVGDCEEMIEIVASSGNDDLANEIEFRVLKHLKLSNLPSLRGFCSGARIVKFPCLENLSMTGCTQLEGFVFDSTDKSTLGNNIEDANSNENIDTEVVQRFLLNNKVELPRLMSLSLKGLTKLTAIWHNQLSDNSFDGENLNSVEIDSCESLKYIFPATVAKRLERLSKLIVNKCGVEEIVAIEGEPQTMPKFIFPKVTCVKFTELPNLTSFYPAMHASSWPALQKLEVIGCYKLEILAETLASFQGKYGSNLSAPIKQTLFTIEKDSFPSLEDLKLSSMEIWNGESSCMHQDVEFPNLKKLSLNGLAKLTTIWNNQLSLGSSKNLETIEIVSCDNLKSVFPASVAKSLQQLRSLKVENCGVEEIISQEEGVLIAPMFVFSKVSYVRFENLPKLKRFYPGLHNCKWPSLESLGVYGCNEVHIFADCTRELNNHYTPDKQPLFLLEKDSFPNLEDLGLDVMENWDSPPLHLLRKLKSLYTYAHTNSSLNSLEQLLGLEKVNGETHAAGDVTFPFLRELYLYGMRKLINLGDDSFGPARLYFPKVEILKLADCDSLKNLRSSAISFNNLTTLKVSRCKGLNYLISFSMATCLMQLTKLKVGDCEEMIEIVASSGNDDLANEIEFRVLKHLELSNLPSLRGFCSGARIVKFPCLENLSMTGCTQLEGFVFDSTDKSTLGNDIEDANSNENIDTGVVQRFLLNNKVELPRLMSLSLEGLTKLTAIWHNQLSDNSFDGENLNSVEIDSCESLKYIFPATVAKRLERLSELIVNECGVEEIVAIEGEPQTMPKFIFPKVTCVKFTELPNLTSFYPAMHASSWPALQKLEVFGCSKLEIFAETLASFQGKYESNLSAPIKQTLFTIEKDSFPSLEDLKLSNMETLNGESSCMHHDVEFPNLKKLSLDGLTKLTTIWNNQLSLGSSKNLETIEIVSCDNLKSVFPASVAKSLQQLRSLDVRNCGVEEIISQEEGVLIAPMFVFSKVSYVRFENLPILKRFYPGLHNCKWPSLAALEVYGCNEVHIFADGTRELNNLYTPDKQSLFLLEKDSFPNLESLGLDVMENWHSPPLHLLRKLKNLYTYAHTNSSLNSLEQLLGLEKVNGETHAAGDATFPFLRELYLYGMRKLINLGDDSFGPARLYFPKVEILKLEDCDSIKNLRSSAISFNNLTTLKVSRCKGLNYLISFSMATCLMQLTKLKVGDCEEMIEIVASSGNDDLANEIEFRVLKHLKLSNLPSLRGFCSGARIVKFPCLENLSMTGCAQLEGFVFDSTDKSTLGNDIEDANSNENIDTGVVQRFLLNNKVELPRLMSLSLEGLTKLTAIWHNQLSDNSFDGENLNSVEIDSCESLKYIFPATVAKRLERLSELIVNKCGVEEIVAIEGEPQTMPKFIFPKVTCVKFTELPNLTSFYPAMHASSWPALQTLEVLGCYKLEILAETLASFQGKYESNQSAPIKQTLFTIEKDSFPSLEDLKLSGMEIWNGPLPVHIFKKLKSPVV
ncbi:hypothetical protein ACLB2K_070500 [Fragaria x ananassa]